MIPPCSDGVSICGIGPRMRAWIQNGFPDAAKRVVRMLTSVSSAS
jgi:hypothetical protein